jgi:hypothetical protein
MGFFFADAPAGGADALDLAVGPGLEYALAITGCDVGGTWRGVARADDTGVWLLPAPGESTLVWFYGQALFVRVASVQLTPRVGGGLMAVSSAGISLWSPGLNCGCGKPRACGCQDPFE